MTTITITKKEYKELYKLKERLDNILKTTIVKEKQIMRGGDLLTFSKLKIKGGPKDLSRKMDSYLYDWTVQRGAMRKLALEHDSKAQNQQTCHLDTAATVPPIIDSSWQREI